MTYVALFSSAGTTTRAAESDRALQPDDARENGENNRGPLAVSGDLCSTLARLRAILNSPPIARLLDETLLARGTPADQLLDEADASALVGIPAKTLGNLRRDGELPPSAYVQSGKRCRVRYVRDTLLLYFKLNPNY